MKTKKSYFSKALVLLMAVMMVFTMMPSGMWGGAETAWAAEDDAEAANNTTVEWAGAANCNPENNNVKTALQMPLDSYQSTYQKWKNEIVHTTGKTAVYAGQTVIVGNYIYISSSNGLEKIDKETGNTVATLEGVGSSLYQYDYLAYDKSSGLLFICDSTMKNAWTGTPNIKAVDLTSFTKVGEITGLSLGAYHPIQCSGNFIFSNGKVFKYVYEEGQCTIEQYDTIEGDYNWSSGCFIEAKEGEYSGKTIFYVASKDKLIAYCPQDKTIIDRWEFIAENTIASAKYGAGVAYSNGRLYFGYYNTKTTLTDGYMFSIKIKADGTLDKTGEGSKRVKSSVQPTLCTPVISNDRVYVAGQSGAVSVYDAETLDLIYVAEANDLYNKTTKAYNGGITKIQSNPILYRDIETGKTYVYFQAYNVPGYIYSLQEEDGATSGTLIKIGMPSEGEPTDSSGAYAMEQIAIDNTGNIYCYNESGYLFCFSKKEAKAIEVNVTFANKGAIQEGKDGTLIADVNINVSDKNFDGKITVDEVLSAMHDTYYEGGATAGYDSQESQYGLMITKLWGDASGAYGYYLNNISCLNLEAEVEQGDYLKTYIYKDGVGYSDVYTHFEKSQYSAKTNTNVTLKLNQITFDENYNPVTGVCEGATVKLLGANSTKDYKTDKNGEISLKFASAGTYKVVALKSDGTIVPSVCTVVVSKDSSVTPTPSEGAKVYFTLMGDEKHDSDIDKKVHTLKSGNLETWIERTPVSISAGDSVGTVFKKVLDAKGYTYTGLAQDYISEIKKPSPNAITLGEKDNGPNSGWMYTVNGKHTLSCLNEYMLSDGDVIVFHYTDDYTVEQGSEQWNGGGAVEEVKDVTTDTKTGTTTAPTDVKVTEKTNADGTKTKVAEVKVSSDNQKEILKQAKANKSKEIILNVSKTAVGDATKADVTLDKSFIDSVLKDTDAKLTVKTPFGDKTYTQDELKALSAAATGNAVTIAVEKAAEEPAINAKELAAKLTPVARSAKTAKKNVKVTVSLDKQDKEILSQLTEAGYTVKYRFYRSTKKSAGYKSTVTKKTATYTNTSGKKGTKCFYKVQVRVYDENGKLVATTALKQCKYASRTWSR